MVEEKEKEQRNIYEKMAVIKSKLLGIKKGGKNDFSHYSYFELGDILPVLTPALAEERLYMKTQFSATEQIAKLIVIDIDNTESQIDFEIRFAECALKGAHEIQNLGAAQTYTRRYLIMTAFDIAEADIVDAGTEQDEKKKDYKKPEQKPQQTSKQSSPAKPTQQAEQIQPQEDMEHLRREIWELIKKLPTEEQSKWINSCKGVDIEKLKSLIEELNIQLNAQPNTSPDEDIKRLGDLRIEFFGLVETLPEEAQEGWLEAANNDALKGNVKARITATENLLADIKKKIAEFEGDLNTQNNTSAGNTEKELEIF